MKQTTHTWIALRAIGLIKTDLKMKGLYQILSPWAKQSSIGCWLPDMASFKKGHGRTNNHTFKLLPYGKPDKPRFILIKNKLLSKLDSNIDLHSFIKDECSLTDAWWKRAYKAKQPDGRHLPDVQSSIFDTILDLILLGDDEVDQLTPGTVDISKSLDDKLRITKEQVSTFFFMISHYVADCFMPCHCDGRPLAAYKNKTHKQWELHWDRIVGDYFSKKKLLKTNDTPDQIIEKAKEVDQKLSLTFPEKLKHEKLDDMWEMAIYWCRASFALSSHIFPKVDFPYNGKETPKFGDHFSDKDLLKKYDKIILQSAVYSTASLWKKLWRKFKA
jgi:hypothetical protein